MLLNFFYLSQRLQGYRSYKVAQQGYIIQPLKVTRLQRLRRLRRLPLKIHTDITKVTRLRRLQFFKIFTNKSKGYKVTEVTRLHRSMPNVFLLSFQVTILSNYS